MKRVRTLGGAALAAVAVTLAFGAPARAVDRALGADVPKPAVTGVPWTEREIGALGASVDAVLAGAAVLRGAHAGIYAIGARDGRVLYRRNADDLFQPASTFKLLVGSAALDTLGASFRFRTDVVANGAVADGKLNGALVLRGGGDPFLNAADLDAAAAAVAKAGITRVSGGLWIDDTHFEPPGYLPGWNWDDFSYYYAPVVSALSFEENVVHLTVTPGPSAGAPATVTAAPIGAVGVPPIVGDRVPADRCEPTLGVVVVPAPVTTGPADAKDTVDVERLPWGCIRVTGTIPLGAKPDVVDAAVPSPATYAHDAFTAALSRRGVGVFEPHLVGDPWPGAFDHRAFPAPSPNATVVWSHDSQPLRDTLAGMWLPSDNLVAELLLRQLGFVQGGKPGTTANGIALERAWLQKLGVDPAAVAIEDGSGLSGYDRITPRQLVTILRHEWDSPNRDVVLDALPIAGVRGTLKSSYAGTTVERKIFAKTGSVSHVSTLAGYAANAKHGAVIFAFQVDDWIGETAALRDLRARVLALFVES